MGEIGSDSGSSYPGGLDTNASPEIDAPNPGKTKARKAVVEDLSACIIAIETTLGVDPQGTKATVVARLNAEHNADGSHKDTLIVTVSGHNQTVTGRKVFSSGISLGVDGLFGTASTQAIGKTTVGASGAMWFSDDVRTSGSFHSTGQVRAESFTQTAGRVSAGVNADKVDSCHVYQTSSFLGTVPATSNAGTVTIYCPTAVPSMMNFIVNVYAGTDTNHSYIATGMIINRVNYESGGQGTLPSEPSFPADNGQININVRNNSASAKAITIYVTIIYK